jgi:hypothetical protein
MDCQVLFEIEKLVKENNEKLNTITSALREISKKLYQIIEKFEFKKEILKQSESSEWGTIEFWLDENGMFCYKKKVRVSKGSSYDTINSSRIYSLKDWNSLSLYEKKEMIDYFIKYIEKLKKKLEDIKKDLDLYLSKLECIEKFIKA